MNRLDQESPLGEHSTRSPVRDMLTINLLLMRGDHQQALELARFAKSGAARLGFKPAQLRATLLESNVYDRLREPARKRRVEQEARELSGGLAKLIPDESLASSDRIMRSRLF